MNLIPQAALIALFPLFFLYNFLISIDFITPFLGGYFTIIGLVFFPLLVINSIRSRNNLSLIELVFMGFMVYLILIACINYISGIPDGFEMDMFRWSIVGVANNTVLYLVFKDSRLFYNRRFFDVLLTSFAFISIVVLINVNEYSLFNPRAGSDAISTYLILSTIYLLVLTVVVAYLYASNSNYFFPLLLFGLIVLFLMGSRSIFIFYTISLILFYSYKNMFKVKYYWYGSIIFFIAVSIVYLLYQYFPESRMFQVLQFSEDISFNNRHLFSMFGLEVIGDNPILGSYGEYALQFGSITSYPHSILAVWVNTGLFGFIYFVAILLYVFIDGIRPRSFNIWASSISKEYSFLFVIFFIFYFTAFFKLIVSDQYLSLYFGIMFGTYLSLKRLANKIRRGSESNTCYNSPQTFRR